MRLKYLLLLPLLMGMSFRPVEICPTVEWIDPTERTNNMPINSGELQYITLYNQFSENGDLIRDANYLVGVQKRQPYVARVTRIGRCPICTKGTATAFSINSGKLLESEMSACL